LWRTDTDNDLFQGSHSGYQRLPVPVTPTRTMTLDRGKHALTIEDTLEGMGRHAIVVPLHLAPGVSVDEQEAGRARLVVNDRSFALTWNRGEAWTFTVEESRRSPSYGVVEGAKRLVWRCTSELPVSLSVTLRPQRVQQR